LRGGAKGALPVKAWNMIHGEEHDEDDGGLHDAPSQIPDRFIIAEEELDGAVHAEFSRYVKRLLSSQPHEAGPEAHQALFDPTVSLEVKREMLVGLARRGTVEAYRVLEQYVNSPDPALVQWGKIALYECRMALETELLEAPVGIISTGLGGARHRLRYLVAVGLSCVPLHDAQRHRLESAWRTTCDRHDSVLEQVCCHADHVMFTLLVSMETAVGTVIDEGMAAANGDDPLLRREYFVTNVAVPTEAELQRILKEISQDETPW
jgi:hypothetical protein